MATNDLPEDEKKERAGSRVYSAYVNDFETRTIVTPSGMMIGVIVPSIEDAMIESSSEIKGHNVQRNQNIIQTAALGSDVDKK